jgi:hypothetical protein
MDSFGDFRGLPVVADEDDGWQGVNAALTRFGVPAKPDDRSAIITALDEQMRLEADEVGDQFLMRLLCGLLFSLGQVEDSLLVWRAKQSNFDTHCGIDVAFLCGAGLEETKAYLSAVGTDEATSALECVRHCEAHGNFAKFSVASEVAELRRFYGVMSA